MWTNLIGALVAICPSKWVIIRREKRKTTGPRKVIPGPLFLQRVKPLVNSRNGLQIIVSLFILKIFVDIRLPSQVVSDGTQTELADTKKTLVNL
jgi:hypothetical protein